MLERLALRGDVDVEGTPTDVVIEGVNLLDAMSSARERRLTIHRGHIVARTGLSRRMEHAIDAPTGAP